MCRSERGARDGGKRIGFILVTPNPVAVRDDHGWRDRARCRDTDPDLFFPVGTTPLAAEQIEAAKAVCLSCSVRRTCLEFALATQQDAGVWGGTSEEERRKLRSSSWLAGRRRRIRVVG